MVQLFLPLALALMMFVLGMNVKIDDFKKITKHPKALILGVTLQLVLLPILAWVVILIAGSFVEIPKLISVGIILLAACPGGATSNTISQLAGGSSALSVSMTVIVSLIVPFILPTLFVFQISLLGKEVNEFAIPIATTTLKLLAVTVVPVLLGSLVRRYVRALTQRHRRYAEICSSWLFIVVVCLIIVSNFAKLVNVGLLMAFLCLSLCLSAIIVTFFISNKAKLTIKEIKTLQIEVGIQNAAMGIFIASDLLKWSELALVPLCYGVLMNLPVIYFVWKRKSSHSVQ